MCICCSWPLLDSQSKAQNFNWLSEPCQPCHSLVCLSQLSWKCWTSHRAFQIVRVFWLDYHPNSPHSHNSMTLQGAFGCDPRRETLLSSCPVMKAYRDGWTRYRERVSRVFRVFVGSSPKVAVTFQCAFQLWRMCDTCCCITPAIFCHTSIHSNHQIDAMQGQKALTRTTAPCQGASHIWRKRKITMMKMICRKGTIPFKYQGRTKCYHNWWASKKNAIGANIDFQGPIFHAEGEYHHHLPLHAWFGRLGDEGCQLMSNRNQQVWFEVQYESGFTAFYSKAKLCNASSYNSAVNPASGKLLRHHQKPVTMTMPPHLWCRRSLWRSRGWRLCWQGGRKRALQLAAWSTQ